MRYQVRSYDDLSQDFAHDLSVYLKRDNVAEISQIKNATRKGQYHFLQQTIDLLNESSQSSQNCAAIFSGAVILVYFELIEEHSWSLSKLTNSVLFVHTLDILGVDADDFIDPESRVVCVTAFVNFLDQAIFNAGDYQAGLEKSHPYIQNEEGFRKVMAIRNRAAEVIKVGYTQMLEQAVKITEDKERKEKEEQERQNPTGSLLNYINPFKSSASTSAGGSASAMDAVLLTDETEMDSTPPSSPADASSSTSATTSVTATIASVGLLTARRKNSSMPTESDVAQTAQLSQ